MKRSILAFVMLFAIAVPCGLRAQNSVPFAPVRNVVDTYFGMRIADPYRWMETANSPELLSYLNSQGERTRSTLSGLASQRSSLLGRIVALQHEVTFIANVQ